MRDTELYAQILGVKAPWFVDKVDLKVSENSVDIFGSSTFNVELTDLAQFG